MAIIPPVTPAPRGQGFLGSILARARGGFNAQRQLSGMLRGGKEAGFFDPRGSQFVREQVRANALRNARNRLMRGGVLSRVLGLDPQQARVAQLQNELGAGSDISGALGEANLQQGLGTQDFFRSLLGGQLNFERQRQLQKQAERAANQQGVGQLIGGLGSAAIGRYGL